MSLDIILAYTYYHCIHASDDYEYLSFMNDKKYCSLFHHDFYKKLGCKSEDSDKRRKFQLDFYQTG